MSDVSIIGVGRTAVGEHWGLSLRELAFEAIQAAMQDANVSVNDIDALIIGNTLGSLLNGQSHLAPMLASYCGLQGVEAFYGRRWRCCGWISITSRCSISQ